MLDLLQTFEFRSGEATRRSTFSCLPGLWSYSAQEYVPGMVPFVSGASLVEEPASVEAVSNSISQLFVARVREITEVERVLWRVEGKRIRIWTIINQPDTQVEDRIYKAQMDLMLLLPFFSFDPTVIFRQNKERASIGARGAIEVFRRD